MKFFYTASVLLLGGLLAGAGEVEDLIAELDSGDKVKRREAARSLALLGPDAKAAVPALVKGLDDLRGDALMQQAFGLLSSLLARDAACVDSVSRYEDAVALVGSHCARA